MCSVLHGHCRSLTAATRMLLSSSGSQQHKEKLAFSSCIHSTASWFFFFFLKASFQILCLAGSESVATKHGPRHQDSAARQTGLGTARSSGTQPHLCKEIAVGLSPSHSSFLCNSASFSTLQWWCEACLVVLVMEREVLGWKALQMSKGLLLFLDVIAHKCVLFPLNETNLIVHSRNS